MQTHHLELTALTALALGASATQAAAPNAELKVIGKIDVPTCIVTAPNNGVYDIGTISSSVIKPGTQITPLRPITQNWRVSCDADTYLTFAVVDNRAGTESSPPAASGFGLGNVNGTGKIGYYSVTITKPTVDATDASTFSTNSSSSFDSGPSATVRAGTYKMGWSAGNALKSGKVFTADLEVRPTLAGLQDMGGPIKEEVNLDGSLTLNFAFGL